MIEIKDKRDQPIEIELGRLLLELGISTPEQVRLLAEPSYFVIIPVDILENKDLSPSAKLLYGEISALTRKQGFCFATDVYIGDRIGMKPRTIQTLLGELEKATLIERKTEKSSRGTYRRIFLTRGVRINQHEGTQDTAHPVTQIRRTKVDIYKKKSTSDNPSGASAVGVSGGSGGAAGDGRGKEVAEIIDAFAKGINPACKRMFGNTNQRKAAEALLDHWPLQQILNVINGVLPQTNSMAYAPTITTPYELEKSWAKLAAFWQKQRSKQTSKGKKIIGFDA